MIDALSYGTCLIKIEGSEIGYIVAKDGKPVYAFLNDYDGEKSYRLLKSMCIVEDVKYSIYKLSKKSMTCLKHFRKTKSHYLNPYQSFL